MEIVSMLVMTILFTILGWELHLVWLNSLPRDHPYLWRSHTIEVLVIIPLIAFYIALLTYFILLKPHFETKRAQQRSTRTTNSARELERTIARAVGNYISSVMTVIKLGFIVTVYP